SSSKVKPYWKPEQPPPWTKTRSLRPGLFSSTSSSRTLAAAASVKIKGLGGTSRSAYSMVLKARLLRVPGPRYSDRRPGKPGLYRLRGFRGGPIGSKGQAPVAGRPGCAETDRRPGPADPPPGRTQRPRRQQGPPADSGQF